MKKLFIIGNGFDLAHGMKTKYRHFKTFLEEEYGVGIHSGFIQPNITLMPDGDTNDANTPQIIYNLLSEVDESKKRDWSTIEENSANFDYDQFINWLVEYDYEKIDDKDVFRNAYNAEDISSDVFFVVSQFPNLFSNWVKSIIINKTAKFNVLKTSNDKFLTFNYTETLEQTYNIKDVLHIHGKSSEDIIFGHGDDSEVKTFMSAEDNSNSLKKLLRKPVNDIILKNFNWFKNLNDIINVYVLGHSLNDIDLPYFKKIAECLGDNAKWCVSYYNETEKERFINVLNKLKVNYTLFNGIDSLLAAT